MGQHRQTTSRRWRAAGTAAALVASTLAWLAVASDSPAGAAALPTACAADTVTPAVVHCTYTTAGEYPFAVPAGIRSLDLSAVGAAGGNFTSTKATFSSHVGGTAGTANGRYAVPAGTTTLYAEVGGVGTDGAVPVSSFVLPAGGYNGGGNGATGQVDAQDHTDASGPGGGGASDVRTVSMSSQANAAITDDANDPRLLSAAGGAGGADDADGPAAGQPGTGYDSPPATPGTATAGGVGGGGNDRNSGTRTTGGSSLYLYGTVAGSGGGGGWFGGGAGVFGSGASGSSVVTPALSKASTGAASGPAEVEISYTRIPVTFTAKADANGTTVSDSATATGSSAAGVPDGSLTFSLFAVGDTSCSGTPVYTVTTDLAAGTGVTASASASHVVGGPGAYRWTADYQGDSAYAPASTACNAPGQTSTVSVVKTTPSLNTRAAPTGSDGRAIDIATLVGGTSPYGGTITFTLYAADDPTCAGTPVGTDTESVGSNGSATSAAILLTKAGSYHWTASYSGDTGNNPVSEACGANGETSTFGTVATIASTATSETFDAAIVDFATVTGSSPTGTVTFRLYGPNDSTCAAAAVFTGTSPLTANGQAQSPSYVPTQAGAYRWIASYPGDDNNTLATGACNDPGETSTVSKTSPALTTQATDATAGGTITDTANLTGLVAPTGTVNFAVYGPGDATCTGTPVGTSSVATQQGHAFYNSAPVTVTAAGTYRWIASYAGDANNGAVAGSCGDANESSVVGTATAVLSTSATGAAVGGPIQDTATVTGGSSPTGMVTFTLYGPADTGCTGAALSTSFGTLSEGGTYSAPYTATSAGTYHWVASYGGDADNAEVSGSCGDAGESSVVTSATPTLSTSASSATVGGAPISDTATVAGGSNPGGSVTFSLYGPGDLTCSSALTTGQGTLSNGTADSPAFTPTATGTYRWVASYGGDAKNVAVTGACGDAGESSVVSKATPTLTTSATDAAVGQPIIDNATISQGYLPKGTIEFVVFGPNDPTCQNGLAASQGTLSGGKTYSSSYTPTAPGTYRWTATYSGDGNNVQVAGNCGDAGESSVVSKATPTLTTSATDATVGGTISDAATLTGGSNPTGTVTFALYGPGDTTCASAAVMTTQVAVSDGKAGSPAFTPTAVGTYDWVASYSGDANNVQVTGTCGDIGESSVVTANTPTLSTKATTGTAGGSITDTASLTGGSSPTGTVTFGVYAPSDTGCTATALATSTITLSGGTATSASFTAPTAGAYRWIAAYNGDGTNTAVSGTCGDPGESSVVGAATPTLNTTADPAVVGNGIDDRATVTGGASPSGTVTFRVYAPGDTSCTTALATSVQPLSGGKATAGYPTTQTGTYRWIATYDGDANNVKVAGACGDTEESSVVTPQTPGLGTSATNPATVGSPIFDTATLTGGYQPTGRVTFGVYAPADTTCSTALATSTGTVGNGTATSVAFTPTQVGTYRWIASYGGDGNNVAVKGACGDPGESSVVGTATPGLSTVATPTTTAGGMAQDVATLTGDASPTGTVTFSLYGPGDTDCTGTPVATNDATITGGKATSTFLPVAGVGDYRWTALYSGDPNNAQLLEGCNGANETTTVRPVTSMIATKATASGIAGGTAQDTATVTGYRPTGEVTFTLYGPDDATCAGTPVGSRTSALDTATASSPAVTVAGVGTYRWTASYEGDENNLAVTEGCNGALETTTVTKAGPTVATKAQSTATAGSTATDSVTVTGYQPTGMVLFRLFGPGDPTCQGTPVLSSEVQLQDGGASSAGLLLAHVGVYHWTAEYEGDANNADVLEPCGSTGESTTVGQAAATVSTLATVSTTAGGTAVDTVMVTGAAPTGQVVFALFGPDDTTCTSTPVATDTETLSDGTATSKPVHVLGVGTYWWTASYRGDADNAAGDEGCRSFFEKTTVDPAEPDVSTAAKGSVVYGARPSDTAMLTKAYQPTGKLTFTLYAGAQCTDPVGSSSVDVQAGTTSYAADVPTVAPGTYHWQAVYSGDANNAKAQDGCAEAAEQVVVTRAPLVISSVAVNGVPAGSAATDTATVTSPSPTGTLTFTLYGPGDTTCTGTPVGTDTEQVATNGVATSKPITVGGVGAYRWVASYDGDAYFQPGAAPCNADGETTTVIQAEPSLTTTASDGIRVGDVAHDTATLAGAFQASGTVTFTLYADDHCGTAVATSTSVVTPGQDTYVSDDATVTSAGTYYWHATYGGDSNNAAASDGCAEDTEQLVVARAAPTATSQATDATVGGSVRDTLTLTGGYQATGTVTFTVYGPTDTDCSGAALATSHATVDGDGTLNSQPLHVSHVGAYRWVASYGGDANNAPVTGTCGDATEISTVDRQAPQFDAHASPQTATTGQSLRDVATVVGDPPTGTITFALYSSAACTGRPVSTATVAVTGSGTYTAPATSVTRPGTYHWVASYSGDVDHLTAVTRCGDAAQLVRVDAHRTVPTTPPGPTTPATPTHGHHDLAFTGSPGWQLVLTGALLLVLGLLLAGLARRRTGRRA